MSATPGPGRPAALTPDIAARIDQLMRAGNYLTTAAAEAGIGRSTLMAWLARGRAEAARLETLNPDHPDPDPSTAEREARYLDLLDKVERAQAAAETIAVTAWMDRIRAGDWRASATFLARTRPDQWGPRTHVRVTDDESQARIDAAVDAAMSGIDALVGITEDDEPDGDGTA